MANLNIKQILGRLKTWIEGHFISTNQLTLPENESVDLTGGVVFEKGARDGGVQKKIDDTVPLEKYYTPHPRFRALGQESLALGRGIASGQGAVSASDFSPYSSVEIRITGSGTSYVISTLIYGELTGGIIRLVNDSRSGDEDYYSDYCIITDSNYSNGTTAVVVDKTIGTLSNSLAQLIYYSSGNLVSGACGMHSFSEGYDTTAASPYSHAEGYSTYAGSTATHTEGRQTSAWGNYSHAEGYLTYANGVASHSEGYNTMSSYQDGSIACGRNTYNNNYNSILRFGNGASASTPQNIIDIDSSNGNIYIQGIGGYLGESYSGKKSIQTALDFDDELNEKDWKTILNIPSAAQIIPPESLQYIFVDDFEDIEAMASGLADMETGEFIEGLVEASISKVEDGIDTNFGCAPLNTFSNTGETLEFDGVEYALFEELATSNGTMWGLLPTDVTLQELSESSMEADYENEYCPFEAVLFGDTDDPSQVYERDEEHFRLVAIR